MGATELIVFAILAGLAWLFKEKNKEEKQLNNSKIPESVRQWEPEVTAAAKEFNVPKTVAMAVLWQESAGNPNARGSSGEVGLMQLKEIAVKDLQLRKFGKFDGWKNNPEQNIRAGTAYLALQKENTGNWFEAVKAYNQGFKGKDQNPVKANNYLKEVKAKEKFFG